MMGDNMPVLRVLRIIKADGYYRCDLSYGRRTIILFAGDRGNKGIQDPSPALSGRGMAAPALHTLYSADKSCAGESKRKSPK